ncbi:MAG: hypothetical protein ACK55I_08815, partial [bacterium]
MEHDPHAGLHGVYHRQHRRPGIRGVPRLHPAGGEQRGSRRPRGVGSQQCRHNRGRARQGDCHPDGHAVTGQYPDHHQFTGRPLHSGLPHVHAAALRPSRRALAPHRDRRRGLLGLRRPRHH